MVRSTFSLGGKLLTIFLTLVIFIGAIAATLVTALARISDGHHYLTDVAAAMLIAVAVQAATIFAMYGKRADVLEFKRFLRPKTEAAA